MNISTSGSIRAKKKVIGSRRMCTASLRATEKMRCNDPVSMRPPNAAKSFPLRPGQGHEHVLEARVRLVHLVSGQAELLDRVRLIDESVDRLAEDRRLAHARPLAQLLKQL